MTYTDEQISEMYDDFLDETYGNFVIGGMAFPASKILFECDPIAYRTGLSDYESFLEED